MNLFSLLAPVYDSLITAIHRRQGGQLLEYLTPWQDKKVLDAGGGTGKLARKGRCNGVDFGYFTANAEAGPPPAAGRALFTWGCGVNAL